MYVIMYVCMYVCMYACMYACIYVCIQCAYVYIYNMVICNVKGSLVRELPSCGRLSWSAFPSSCQPHRCVNHQSSSSWEMEQFGRTWIHGWKRSRARNSVCLRVKVSVSAGPRLDLGTSSTKSAQDCGESSACTSKCKQPDGSGAFWKMRSAKSAQVDVTWKSQKMKGSE